MFIKIFAPISIRLDQGLSVSSRYLWEYIFIINIFLDRWTNFICQLVNKVNSLLTVGFIYFLKTSIKIVYYYIVKSSNSVHFKKINKLKFFSYIQNVRHNIYYNYGVLTFLFLNHFSISNVLHRKIRIQTWCIKLLNEWTCLS